jgi:hypothetical protein
MSCFLKLAPRNTIYLFPCEGRVFDNHDFLSPDSKFPAQRSGGCLSQEQQFCSAARLHRSTTLVPPHQTVTGHAIRGEAECGMLPCAPMTKDAHSRRWSERRAACMFGSRCCCANVSRVRTGFCVHAQRRLRSCLTMLLVLVHLLSRDSNPSNRHTACAVMGRCFARPGLPWR